MADKSERGFASIDLSSNPPWPNSVLLDEQSMYNSENHQRKYSPPPFHKLQQEYGHARSADNGTLSGDWPYAYRTIYDDNWRLPQSPRSIDGQSQHDTTRSRLEDDRFIQPDIRTSQKDQQPVDFERRRVIRFRQQTPSLASKSDVFSEGRRRSRTRHGSRTERAHHRDSVEEESEPAKKSAGPTNGLDTVDTTLRLGLLLGCFGVVCGSLSAWVMRERYRQDPQKAVAASEKRSRASHEGRRSRVHSKHSHRSRGAAREEDKRSYYSYDVGSEPDPDHIERQRRVAEHVREQRQMAYERDLGRRERKGDIPK